jgi:hypothetical protein
MGDRSAQTAPLIHESMPQFLVFRTTLLHGRERVRNEP